MAVRLLTKAEFARFHCVSEGTVDQWIRQGKIVPKRTPGGYPRFLPPDDWSPEIDTKPDAG